MRVLHLFKPERLTTSRNFRSVFMPLSFNFTAKIGNLIPGTFFFWRQNKLPLFGKTEAEVIPETRIKDKKTKVQARESATPGGIPDPRFSGKTLSPLGLG